MLAPAGGTGERNTTHMSGWSRLSVERNVRMIVLKFLVMAVAALVDKIFQAELRPKTQDQTREALRAHFYRAGEH